jgi:hypothetical protein
MKIGRGKSLARISFAALLLAGVTVPTSRANASKKPPAPVITVLTRVQGKNGLFNLKVTVELPRKLSGGSARTEIVSKRGSSCRINGNRTTCTIVGLKKNLYMPLRARSSDSSGAGVWSKYVDYHTSRAAWVRSGYDANGKRMPGAIPSTSLYWKMLGTTSKWTKFQALKRSTTSSASFAKRVPRALTTCGNTQAVTTTTTAPAPTGDPCVVFNLEGIVGLAMATSSSSCGSSVDCALAVTRNGATASLYAAGGDSPAVKDFYSAPNGRVFVVFKTATRLVVGGAPCVFVEVNTDTGVPTCVDPEMITIQDVSGGMGGSNRNPPVQFDSAGAVYYVGTGPATQGFAGLTLRRAQNGAPRNLVNDNISIYDFVVLGDGTVLLFGQTTNTGQYWLRKMLPSGAVTNLDTGLQVTFMRMFADGNIYVGKLERQGNVLTNGGIYRYDHGRGELDALPWTTSSGKPAQNDIDRYCGQTGAPSTRTSWCGGVWVNSIANFGSSRTFGVQVNMEGSTWSSANLVQYWPAVEPRPSILSNIYLTLTAGDYLLLAGTTATKTNMLTAFNTLTNQEEIVLDDTSEVEIYSMAYVPSTKKVMFNGLNFADGKYIVSEVAIP